MFPLLSCCELNSKDISETVTFACLLAHSYPPAAEILWDLEEPTKMEYPPTPLKAEPSLWLSASQLTVQVSDFVQKAYTCTMKREVNTEPLVKATIDSKNCTRGPPEPIQVQILSPGCNEKVEESNLELVCLLRSPGFGSAGVEWLKNGEVFQNKVEVTLTANKNLGNTYFRFVRQSILKESWDKGDRYTCKVYRPPKSENITLHNTSKCEACYSSMQQPTISVTKPSPKNLFEGKANLTCTVVGPNLDHVHITWYVDGKPSTEGQKDAVKVDASGSQNVRGFHPVSLEQWRRGTKFTCKAAGPCYEEVSQDVTIKTDSHATKPSVAISRTFLDVSLKSTMALILLCDVSGFSPQEISISWQRDNKALNENLYDHGTVMPTGSLYNTYSLLKISRDEPGGRAGNYSCVVHHSSSETPITASENVPIGFLEPSSPKVMVFHTSGDGECQKLVCFATNFYPQNISIQWSIQGHDLSCSSESSGSLSLADGTFQKNCSLVLRGEECKKQEMYTCTVTHSSTNTFIKKTVPSCGMTPSVHNKTEINMQPPSFEDLLMNKRAAVTCMMPLVNATSNSTINWTMDGKPADMNAVTTEVFSEDNGTLWITGQLWVNLSEWRATRMFTCNIHNDLGETKQNLDRRDGIMKAPEVYLQQSSKEGINVTLVCMARNFYPAEIFLKWEEEDKERSLKSYEAHNLNCNHEEQRCSLVSILEVPMSKWMMGVSYTCLVAHVSSENIITRRTSIFSDSWDCAIMGVALCDVRNENEDEYSELEDANSVWNKVSTFMVLFVVALFYGGLVTFIKVK